MAVYKVIQDVEAEDKLLGPLTLKGFIYAIVAAVLGFLIVRLAISGSFGQAKWALIILMLPPMILFAILASPLGKEQPTEVWLLSHVRFFLKPHKKIWDQSGAIFSVIITAPKKIEKHLTKEFSQTEVQSRLKALAATLDSRGWAIKNSDVNLAGPPGYTQAGGDGSQRLVMPSGLSQATSVLDIHAKDDILDADNNTTAQYFDQLVQKADVDRKQAMLEKFDAARKAGQDMQSGTGGLQMIGDEPTTAPEDQALIEHGRTEQQKIKSHPSYETKPSLAEEKQQKARQPKPAEETKAKPNPVTTAYTADKMELAKSGNAFSVASLSELANRHREGEVEQIGPNEVVIHVH